MSANIQEILVGINHKDLKAWEKLYASYYAALCSYVQNMIKDQDAAQDVVQDTLIKIWHSEQQFPDMKELTWYLYRAVYNNALFYLRTLTTRQNILRQLPFDEPDMPEEQFAKTVQEELIRQLHIYISELPEKQKEILLLSIEGHSGNEIAEMLGISINTVKTQKTEGLSFCVKS